MYNRSRSWDDGKQNWWLYVIWCGLLWLICKEAELSPAMAACLVVLGMLLRQPLRGLDVGRVIWGFYGVASLMLISTVSADSLPVQLFSRVLACGIFGYELAAWERCRFAQRFMVLILLATLATAASSLFLETAHAVWIISGLLCLVTVVLAFGAPQSLFRALLLPFSRTVFRVRAAHENGADIPATGPVLIVSNHVSFFDIGFILAVTPRKVIFPIDAMICRRSRFGWYLRMVGFIEVPDGRHPKLLRGFFAKVHEHLRNDGAVAFYPEGGISGTGVTGGFRRGLHRLLPQGKNVPVVPVRLGLYWGKLFAIDNGKLRFIKPLRWPIPVTVTIGHPVPGKISSYKLWMRIAEMGADTEREPQYWEYPMHIAFAQRAQASPRQVTFSDYEGKRIKNIEMLIRALALSRLLRRMDLGDKYVGMMLPGTTAAVTATMGIMFADRTPALLNFTTGPEALAASIKQARIKCILTSRLFLAKLKMEPLPGMVMLEDLALQVTGKDKLIAALGAFCLRPVSLLGRVFAPESWRDVERDGALLFTSGSSGKPKGVMLSHHNINSDCYSFWRVVSWSHERFRIIGHMPLFHTFGMTVSFWFPAISGTPVCYMPNPLDAVKVCKLIREEKINLLIATPTFLQNYCRKAAPGDFDSLDLVITGAEKLRPEVVAQLEKLVPITVTEGYGTTELSPITAINLAQSYFAIGKKIGKTGSIGQPLPGIAARTVDVDTGEVQGANCVGLLEFKGPNVMTGYLDEPEKTAEVIHDGWYNTGDLARIDEDGYIFITGRLSRFSKIGGEMVPHELIEQRLTEFHPSEDRHFAVTGCKDAKRGERIVVFHNVDQELIPGFIARMREAGMPNLWIPKSEDFVRIDTIPIMGNGKLDLQALRKLADAHGEAVK